MSETFVNFLGGSPLNRLSWLRPSQAVLNAIIVAPATRWLLLNGGQPLITTQPDSRRRALAYLSTDDVRPFLGPEPFFGQGQEEGEDAPLGVSVLEASRHRGTPILFLGLQEPQSGSTNALPSSDFTDPKSAVANLSGTPFFSMNVANFEEIKIDSVLKSSSLARNGETLTFSEPRAAMNNLDAFHAAVFAEARSMVDWNERNKFCPACGSPTYSIWAGWKLSCSTLLPWADNTSRKPCPTAKGLHNFTHPRTDPVVIMLAIDESGDKALLGRSKKFPEKFYSALAGFMEPGESLEDAVKREMWEEAGVKVWNIRYHSGQPWPYPANLMVGFYATADSSQPIRTDLDNELEDARWYTREEILAVLRHPSGTNFSKREYKAMDDDANGDQQHAAAALAHSDPGITAKEGLNAEVNRVEPQVGAAGDNEPPFRVPPMTAIAGVLIRHWVEEKMQGNNATMQKGNL